MKYYIARGTTPVGPLEIDQLRDNGLEADTLVWTAGMPDWVPARDVAELQGLFEPVPPPLTPPAAPATDYVEMPPVYNGPQPQQPYDTAPQYDQQAPAKPFDWLWPSILVTICCCTPLAIVGIVFAAQVNSCWNRGDYDGAYRNAGRARTWTLVALGLSIVGNILYAAFSPSILSSFNL